MMFNSVILICNNVQKGNFLTALLSQTSLLYKTLVHSRTSVEFNISKNMSKFINAAVAG